MRKYLLTILSLCNLFAFAQPYCGVRTFNIRDGLAANVISGISQTPDDLMWFTTWNGLCYFDGYQFTTFRDEPGQNEVLTTNRLQYAKASQNGNIWCMSYDGYAYLFDSHQRQFVNVSKLVKDKYNEEFLSGKVYPLANGYTWIPSKDHQKISIRVSDAGKIVADSLQLIKDLDIRMVQLDADSAEWVFTEDGIWKYGSNVKANVRYEYIVSLGGATYFASKEGELGYYKKGSSAVKPIDIGSKGKLFSKIYCMTVRGDDTILMGTDKGLLYYFVKTGETSLVSSIHPNSFSNEVKHIFVDSRQRIWFFTSGEGLLMIDPKTSGLEWVQCSAQSTTDKTTSSDYLILEDQYHTIWAVPEGGTFGYYDEQKHQMQPYQLRALGYQDAGISTLNRLFVDNQHNLWFTGDRDLSVINFKYRRVKMVGDDSYQEVRAILTDKEGRTWAGYKDGYLSVAEKGSAAVKYLSPSGSLQTERVKFSTHVYSLYQDKKGRIWIGTKEDGLFCISNGKLSHFKNDDSDKWSISNNDIYDIDEDSKGHLWIATFNNGLNMLCEGAEGKMQFVNVNNELKNYPNKVFNKIRRITHTPQGVVVLSANNGLVTFSDNFKSFKDIKFYTTQRRDADTTSLITSDVLQTLVTRKGDLFVATMGGGFQKITSENLLQNDLKFTTPKSVLQSEGLVQSLVEDKRGDVWLVRETTIDSYNPKTGTLQQYGPNELSGRIEFSEAKPTYVAASDQLLMGVNGGYILFSPKQMVKSSYQPKIAFTSVKYQGERETRPILNADVLHVASNERNFTISFAALDYSDNYLIQYAYKLEGEDDDWNYVGAAHSASFNNFPHGEYRLLVRSTNADGVWQNNERVLVIDAEPTFWESWMGWLLRIFIVCGLGWLIAHLFVQRQHIKLQDQMTELRTRFFTNIGHKLRTPLTLIGGPVTEVLQKENLTDKGRDLMEMVQRNSRDMLDLVNNMLNYENSKDNYFVDDVNAPVFAQTEKQEALIPKNGPSHPDIKLLVVEDNHDLRSFLVSILSSDYTVIDAENGRVGLEKAANELPDFIISDVMMPEMDGLTMVHTIKQDKNISHIPIIILSAKASLEDKLLGLREGIDDYITKPFSATYLKQRVENIISQRRSFQQRMLEELQLHEKTIVTAKEIVAKDDTSEVKPVEEEYKLQSPEIIDEDKLLMQNLLEYIEKNVDNADLTIDDLASAVNLGRTVFYGKLKSIVGMAPVDFLRHVRIQRSEELVAKSTMKFAEIAYAVGFSDPKYFSKCFKKETGMTPSEYRATQVSS